ncbi:MAG: NAD(P)/FAD-dependent oxidoreductase, partial [Methylotenera sp.]|nr:NAD(P)/FAD-dependent oxidoreductase [Flavobacterium sp.]
MNNSKISNNDIAVIGAGISGISISKMLIEEGKNVTLFEKNKKIGGLIKCERINDNLFHRVGGHVFNSKNKDVLTWFWKYF